MNSKRYLVRWGIGGNINVFYTRYHAEQCVRALILNGTPAVLIEE